MAQKIAGLGIGFLILITPFSVLGITQTTVTDLELDNSEYFSISDASQTGLDLSGDFTVEWWAKVESLGNAQVVVSKWSAGSFTRSYQIKMNPTAGTVQIFTSSDGNSTNTTSVSTTIGSGVWNHWAVTVTSGTMELFKDGISQGTSSGLDSSLFDSGTWVQVGATDNTPEQFFDGKLDDVRIWSDVRTDVEIADNDNNCDLSTSATNLEAWYSFESSDGTDETANNNDLTENNTPSYDSADAPYECSASTVESYWVNQQIMSTTTDAILGATLDWVFMLFVAGTFIYVAYKVSRILS